MDTLWMNALRWTLTHPRSPHTGPRHPNRARGTAIWWNRTWARSSRPPKTGNTQPYSWWATRSPRQRTEIVEVTIIHNASIMTAVIGYVLQLWTAAWRPCSSTTRSRQTGTAECTCTLCLLGIKLADEDESSGNVTMDLCYCACVPRGRY